MVGPTPRSPVGPSIDFATPFFPSLSEPPFIKSTTYEDIWTHPPSSNLCQSNYKMDPFPGLVHRGVGPFPLLVRTSYVHAPRLSRSGIPSHTMMFDVRSSLASIASPPSFLPCSISSRISLAHFFRWRKSREGRKRERRQRVESFSLLFPPFFHQFRRGS